jgi:rod shape-determining protein MreD
MKTQGVFWIMTFLLVFVLHILMAEPMSVLGSRPNFFLLATIFFAIRGGPVIGELLGFSWGLLADVTSISLFGSQTFMLTLVGYIAGRLEGMIDEEKYSAQMVLVLLLSCLNIVGLLLLEILFKGVTERFRDRVVVLGPIYSTLLSPILFWALLQWTSVFHRTDLKVPG